MRRYGPNLIAIAVCVALGFALSGANLTADDEERFSAAKFAGSWELVRSEVGNAPKGAVVQFTIDGKLIITANVAGLVITFTGTYRVEGDKLHTTITDPSGGKDVTDIDTIKVLTNEKIVLVDQDKKENEFKKKK